jgi:hypothetical protein
VKNINGCRGSYANRDRLKPIILWLQKSISMVVIPIQTSQEKKISLFGSNLGALRKKMLLPLHSTSRLRATTIAKRLVAAGAYVSCKDEKVA